MLEVQAAVGRIQINRMEKWSARRRKIATEIAAGLADFDDLVRAPMPESRLGHAFYRFYAYVNQSALGTGWTRDRIIAEIEAKGVPVFQGSCSEVYLEKAFDKSGFRPAARLEVARELGETSLMFLTHPTIEAAEIEKVIDVTRNVLNQARR
jgi:dTDP-4-amino-4,6-dideoxygalactose transaminase